MREDRASERGMRGVGCIAARRGQEGREIVERSDDRSVHFRLIAGMCAGREPKGDFVRMLAQIQIGELGVENDSAKESSIGERTSFGERYSRSENCRWDLPRSTGCDFYPIVKCRHYTPE